MTPNVGHFDRIIRFVVGVALLAWALGLVPGLAASPWGWIGALPVVTSFIGWCPVYNWLGITTLGHKAH